MYHLESVFPIVRKIPIRLQRDPAMLFMLAINQLLLGVETYSAHIISGTIVFYEWIPILFSPVAGALLLFAGLLSFRNRKTAVILANGIFLASIVVGLLGAYFHFNRAFLPDAPAGNNLSIPFIIWAPPLIAPLTFCLIGVLGLSMVWQEKPADSGILQLFNDRNLSLPLSKSRACFFMICLGCLATVSSSVIDHARTNFSNPWLWLPVVVGIFATMVAYSLGVIEIPSHFDVTVYLTAMVLMILTGLTGSWLHIQVDLTSGGDLIIERIIRGAPVMAPMLFADMGLLGAIVLLDPE